MVVVSKLPHAEFVRNYHQKDTPWHTPTLLANAQTFLLERMADFKPMLNHNPILNLKILEMIVAWESVLDHISTGMKRLKNF